MDYFYKFNGFKHLVLLSILCSFPLAVLTIPPVYGQVNIGFKDVNFGVRIQKLIDRAWKYYDNLDSNSLLDVILDIKSEVEAYTGKKIDISKEVDKIENDIKKKGSKPPKDIFKKFKSLVHSKEKKKLQRTICIESYFIEQPNMSFQDYEIMHLSSSKKKDQDKDKKELPLKFVVAVTLMLGGAFVMFATPICPVLGYAGEMMITTGFGMMIDQGLDVYQKEK